MRETAPYRRLRGAPEGARNSASAPRDAAAGIWLEALEAAGRAVLGLDAAGRVVSCSPDVPRLLGARVQLLRRRLVIGEAGAQRQLAALIKAALRHEPSQSGPLPPPLVLRRASGRHLHIDVLPVQGAADTAALLLLRETEGDAAPRAELLRQRFRLTPAELRLTLVIADGTRLCAAAEVLGIRMSTARAHLKSVFLKTETHRQAELVALCARLG